MIALPNGPDRWTNQTIQYCGHDGTFHGEVILTPEAAVVLAGRTPVTSGMLRRPARGAQWAITDMYGGYWGAQTGIFVLPRKSITKLT